MTTRKIPDSRRKGLPVLSTRTVVLGVIGLFTLWLLVRGLTPATPAVSDETRATWAETTENVQAGQVHLQHASDQWAELTGRLARHAPPTPTP